MISETDPVFPNNAVNILIQVLPAIDEDIRAFPRPLRPTDPNMSIGIYPTVWQPEEDSFEIGHQNPGEPTLGQYTIGIQTLTKHGDTVAGLSISSIFTKRVRDVLYRNQPLRAILGGLTVEDDDGKESVTRWGIRNHRYLTNDIEGKFVFVSVLDLYIETETK